MLDLAAFTLAPLPPLAQCVAILLAAAGGLALGRWTRRRPARALAPSAEPLAPKSAQTDGVVVELAVQAELPVQPALEVEPSAALAPTVVPAGQAAEAHEEAAADLSLMRELGAAIQSGHIDVHLQPKYDVRRGCVSGVEALVRWRHPSLGLLAPDRFIPVAERTGHIRALSEHVLARATDAQATLQLAGHAIDMSVNVSASLLADPAFVDAALALTGRARGQLCFEIAETTAGDVGEAASASVERLAAAHVALAIDDFGAGRCSLVALRRIAAQELKIDRSLVLDLADARRNALLVRAAVEFGHSLGMKVTAKGVETNEAFALLAAMGCDFAQGFLIEQPMPLEDLLSFLAEDQAAMRYG